MFTLLQQHLSSSRSAPESAPPTNWDVVSGSDAESLIQDPSTPVTGTLIGTVADGNGLLIHIYGVEVEGGVSLTVKVMEGVADLRGFFMDVGEGTTGVSIDGVASQDVKIGDESVTTVGSRDNNMNGTGETFDVGVEIGTAGYGRDDVSQASFTLEGVTLDQLDGLSFGVRATSVGEDRDDGVKLVGEFDIPEPPVPTPSIDGNFPQLADDITSITLFYDTPAGDITGDNLYAARVENVSWIVEDDLDLWLLDATDYFEENDSNVDDGTQLLGVAITHGADGATEYYAMDDDPGSDAAPTADLQTPDATVAYDMIMG